MERFVSFEKRKIMDADAKFDNSLNNIGSHVTWKGLEDCHLGKSCPGMSIARLLQFMK